MCTRQRLRFAAIPILLLLTGKCAFAQTLSVKNFTTQDGLPSAEVFHILQDQEGFLWFSTSNGIASFDGYRMKAYSVDDGVPDPLVLETREDEKGRIWMRSFSGRIAFHDRGKIHPFIYNDSLRKFCAKSFLESFAQDSSGRWVFYESEDKFCIINQNGSLVHRKQRPELIVITSYPDQLVIQNSIFEKVDSVLIDRKLFPIDVPPNDPKFDHHHLSVIRWNKNIFFSVRNNVFRYDGQHVKRVLTGGAPIINLSTDRHGRFYVGYMSRGAVRYRNMDLTNGDTLSFTRNHSVSDVQEDREGGLWVSTLEAGVFYVPSTDVTHYSLPGNSRIRTALVHDGKIFIGNNDGSLLVVDEKSKQILDKRILDRTIMALYANNDTLFAGTATYLQVLTYLKRGPIRNYKGNVLSFMKRDGHVLALSGRSMALYRGDGVQLKKFRYERAIRAVYEMGEKCFVVPHLGIEICDKNLEVLSRPAALKDYKISQLQTVDDNTVVLGTIGSGLIIANQAFSSISTFAALPRDIYSIVKLDSEFYFASEQGIFMITADDLRNRRVRTVLVNEMNGLVNRPISLLKTTSNGKLAVFYDRSFSIVDPAALRNLNTSPHFYLDAIIVNNLKRERRPHYELPYDSNFVQFDFGFVAFNNQDIYIRYKLREDDSWIYPQRTNSISLYSLAPGQYHPQLEFTADRFTWQQAPALPSFEINYPWWKNPYLYTVAFSILCIIVFVIVRNRLEIQRERNARLKLVNEQQQKLLMLEKETTNRERNRIATDLHDGIGSSLLAIKLSIGRILKHYNNQDAAEIDAQLSSTLNEIKNIIYDLSPAELERDGLFQSVKNYIDKLSGVTEMELKVSLFGEDKIDLRIVTTVFRTLQELLANSIKHSSGTTISVHINSFANILNIVYEDNGKGFSPALSAGIGKGITNVQARIRSVNGTLKIDSGDYGLTYIIDIPISMLPTAL